MAPYNKDSEVQLAVHNSIIQAAVPFNKADCKKTEKQEAVAQSTTEVRIYCAPSINDDLEEAAPLRVSTRATYSYELDRYSKHAMLIFEGHTPDVVTEEEQAASTENMSSKFKQIFENYGFEIEIHSNLNDTAISNVCDTFFNRDFTEYGCVAIMMLPKTKAGVVESSHTPDSEHRVFRYLSYQLPPTLQDKPKIYIVQTATNYVMPRPRAPPSIPEDILEVRFPVPCGGQDRIYCLLNLIYEKINTVPDCYLDKVLEDSVDEFRSLVKQVLPSYDFRSAFISTLTKELRLAAGPGSSTSISTSKNN